VSGASSPRVAISANVADDGQVLYLVTLHRRPNGSTGNRVTGSRSWCEKECTMRAAHEAPVDLDIAAYVVHDASKVDWDTINQLAGSWRHWPGGQL
jgi:hypothetical protein